jgi:hypothetical protein
MKECCEVALDGWLDQSCDSRELRRKMAINAYVNIGYIRKY